jgi:hypothetical protein
MGKIKVNMKGLFRIAAAILLFTITYGNVSAQRKPGNEWINYSQTYYRVKVVQNGIYRLSYNDLQGAGMNVTSLNPTHLQMFFRGSEIPIYVSSGGKSSFSASDYIEFYGQGNDGALDSVLFLNPADDINKSFSMFTDTAAYFLTESPVVSTMRYAVSNKIYANVPAGNYLNPAAMYLHLGYWDGKPLYPEFNFTESDYNQGEGWMGGAIACTYINIPVSKQYTINTPGIPSDTTLLQKPVLDMLIYGKSDVSTQNPDHHLVILSGNKIIWDTVYDGFAAIHKQLTRYWSDITKDVNGNTVALITVRSAGVQPTSGTTTSDVHVVSFLKFIYPAVFNIDPNNPVLNFNYLNPASTGQTDFNFTASGVPSTGKYLVLYDLKNRIRTAAVTMSGTSAQLSIDNFHNNASYYLYDTLQAKNAISIVPVNFVNPDPSKNYNYIIITNKAFATGAKAFADYKTTQKIDSANYFNPLIVYADDLYDQFFYGVHHPAALQNFLAYMYLNAAAKPQYLLLLGKGINTADVRTYFKYDYVPSIGYPPADVMFTAGIDIGFQGKDKVIDPKMGIGRLQILNNNDIYTYLDKLKAYDANLQQPQLYLKSSINVDGGDNAQITQIRNFMDQQAKILSGPYAALKVNSYYSISNSAVNKNLKAAIQSNIESGTSMLSYLAHGAPEQFQVEIADTPSLKNKGRYPIMYLNGCNLGNAFLNPGSPSAGRFYTLAKNKGAIIWLSHSNEALDDVLYAQMPAFFNNIAKNNYGRSIGSSWRKTIVDIKNYHSVNEFRALCYSWVLQGDPSVMFPSQPKTDYALYDSLLFITPKGTIATSPTFNIAIPVINLGKTDNELLKIRVKQTFPDKTFKITDSSFQPVNLLDTLYFVINRKNTNIQGINKFDIYVNYDSSVKEMSYANNHASFSHYFEGNNVRALFPTDYNIENVDTPTLIAQSRNPLAFNTGIYFEMDTTDLFNSPLKQSSGLLKSTSLITWKPRLNNRDKAGNAIDSTVYYWRTRMNLPADTGGEWETRSFVYLKKGHHGWSQSHWQQYKQITGNQVIIDTNIRKFTFLPSYANIHMEGSIFSFGTIKQDNGFAEIYGTNIGNCTVAIIEYDKYTLKPYHYNRISGKRLRAPFFNSWGDCNYIAYDLTNSLFRDSFKKEINLIPEGNLILLISRGQSHHQYINLWDDSTFKAFELFGDTMMRHLKKDSVAFAIAGYKGSPKGKLVRERYKYAAGPLPGPTDTADMELSFQGIANDSGQIISQNIGPATSWKTMFQVFRPVEKVNAGHSFMRIDGIDSKGVTTKLYDSVKTESFDVSKVDAARYPFVRLTATLSDTLTWSPPQLRLWQVEYDGIPEGSLIGEKQTIYPAGTYNQGDSIHIRIKFQNISDLPMRKVLVKFNISDANNVSADSASVFYPALQPGEYFWIDTLFSTQKLDGNNYLTILVNPGYNQPEITLDNNFFQSEFFVNHYRSNPIIDVTFDGVHIADGQIVSPDPEIMVSTKDYNHQLLLNDTADFKLTLLRPGASKEENIWFSNPKVTFIKADSTTDVAKIKYHPGPLSDGVYRFNAQAWNRTGNIAGPEPYSIHFQVINAPAISGIYFYPNPLTDVSRFVFTITGPNVPDQMDISVFDVSGKLVTTLDLTGKIKAGVNEINWDGTNDNGAKLQQGVYFYKATVKYQGTTLQNFPVSMDATLKKGFGKIMIIRN